MVVALTNSPDRLREYADDARHARFVDRGAGAEAGGRLPLVRHAAASAA